MLLSLTMYVHNNYIKKMNMSATIHIMTDPKIKAKAQKIAKKMGLNLTLVLNNLLKEFIQKQSIEFTVDRTLSSEQEAIYLEDIEAVKDEKSFSKVDDLMTSLRND